MEHLLFQFTVNRNLGMFLRNFTSLHLVYPDLHFLFQFYLFFV